MTRERHQRHLPLLAAATAFALAFAVRVPTLGRSALANDEFYTGNSLRLDWWAMVLERRANIHFPGYFALLKGIGATDSEFLMRLPSALFDSGAAALAALVALRLGGPLAAAFCAAIYAFQPFMIFYGQEARPYALLLLLLGIVLYCHVALIDGRRHTAASSIAAALAIWTIPSGIASVAALHLALVIAAWKSLDTAARRSALRQFAVSGVAAVLALAFLLGPILAKAQAPDGLLKWQARTPAGSRIAEDFVQAYGFGSSGTWSEVLRPTGVPALLLLALAIGYAIVRRQDARVRLLAIVAFGTPLLFLLIGIVSVTASRYLIGMMPPTIILAAGGLAAFVVAPGFVWARRIGAGLFLIAMAGVAALYLLLAQKYDMRVPAAFIANAELRDVEIDSAIYALDVSLGHYLPRNIGIGFTVRPAGPDGVIQA